MLLSKNTLLTASKVSLSLLWIFTGLTSLFFSPELGLDLLKNSGFSAEVAHLLVFCGSAVDIGIGLWVLSGIQLKLCSLLQIIVISTYTILLTIIEPSYWLHPFGPLTKNFPIIVLILTHLTLYQATQDHQLSRKFEKG